MRLFQLLRQSKEKGFGVLHIHDVKATLAGKGFDREPLKVIEICNAKYASEVLSKDIKISLMLPCPISVYVEGGKTYISTLMLKVIDAFYPEAGIQSIAEEVDRIVLMRQWMNPNKGAKYERKVRM